MNKKTDNVAFRGTKYLFHALLWALLAVSLFFAGRQARQHRRELRIASVSIEILDSTAHGQLVTRESVERWIRESGLAPVGKAAECFDLGALERVIARNGFVGRVRASVTRSGVLRIGIRQREPLFRLLVDGYDCYVTGEGDLFAAPRNASIYVPVVTGTYRPPFPAGYEGRLSDLQREQQAEHEKRLAELEAEKYPFYRRERANLEYDRETRRERIRQAFFESKEHFRGRVEQLLEKKRLRRRHFRYEKQQILQGIAAVEQRQETERRRQKKLQKSYEDFSKLITFVKRIDADAFWRSEIVQIVASGAPSGSLELDLVPRSSDCVVRFGRLEAVGVAGEEPAEEWEKGVAEKLDRMERFFERGFGRLGWDAFRVVDLRFRGQVVCSE